MLSAHCPRHGREVLVSPRQVVDITGSGERLTVRWVCACGHRGAYHPHRAPVPA